MRQRGKEDNTGHVKKQVPRVGNWDSIWLGTAGTLRGDCLWVTHLRGGEDGNLFTNSLSLLLRTCSKVLQLFSNSVLLACRACFYIQRSLVSPSERNHWCTYIDWNSKSHRQVTTTSVMEDFLPSSPQKFFPHKKVSKWDYLMKEWKNIIWFH